MTHFGTSVGIAVVLSLTFAAGCNKTPGASDAPAAASSGAALAATSPSPSAATAGSAEAAAAAPLSGFDSCLVGSWKSTRVSMKLEPMSAEGGANLALDIRPTGDSVIDFTPMAPIHGKTGAADFDFQYAGKASALLSTPTRGSMGSANPDYSGLKVSATVALPGAGKIPLFKNKPVSELAQMAAAMAGAGKKTPAPAAAAAPPGIDSSPVFSTTRYACQGDSLTLFSDKAGAEWAFTRTVR